MSAFMPELSQFIDFRDKEACARVRAITRAEITKHKNPDFHIRVRETTEEFYAAFALDIVQRIVAAANEGRQCAMILPVGPVPQFAIAAMLINGLGIDCKHLVTFNMDEYADENGQTAPAEWDGSFATAMWKGFFGRIDQDLRPLSENIHFPSTMNINAYSDMIVEATGGKGVDCCYGGIGWCGHIAFWESHLGHEFASDEEWRKAKARIVELNPMTIMQNALHSFGGDWSWVPPKACSIGPADIVGAQYRSFWLDGVCGPGTTMAWQRFIARLAAHGPVTRFVPGTVLQTVPGDYTILGVVAEDVKIEMA
jgi:glucosamine-6-phosphate deaminase